MSYAFIRKKASMVKMTQKMRLAALMFAAVSELGSRNGVSKARV